MADLFDVYIDINDRPKPIGQCRYLQKHQNQTSAFQYDLDWLTEDCFAIDPENLPLTESPWYRQLSGSSLPGAIRDSAPDQWGRQLIQRAYRKNGVVRQLTEVDYLLGVNDYARVGALRFKRPGEADFRESTRGYSIPRLFQLPQLLDAANAIHTHTESASDLQLLLNEGSPLGGARPKSAVLDRDGSMAIAKFTKPDEERSLPHGEVLAMHLARNIGLNVASARLVHVLDQPVAIITRFDRTKNKRMHFISAMSMLGHDDRVSASYTDIAEIIRKHSSQPTQDLHELFNRVIFNVLISNLDDHLRNHGFLYDANGKWRLSPAYDLNPVPLHEANRELSTWISDESSDADLELARNAAPYFALTLIEADHNIQRQKETIAHWRTIARKLEMSKFDIEAYATAFCTT